MNQNRKHISAVMIICMLAAALFAAGCGGTTTEQAKPQLSELNITYVKSPLNVPSIVEKHEQLVEKEFSADGIKINYAEITSGSKQTEALAAGSIDICNAVGTTSCILAASNGVDLKIIGIYSRAPEAFMIIAMNPEIKTVADLKGKKVAGPKGTVLHQMLLTALVKNDLKPEDIEHIAMEQPDAVTALINGSVDAVIAAGANADKAIKAGGYVITNGKGLVDGTSVVAVSGKFLKEHPDIVKRFQKVHQASLAFIKEHQEEAFQMAAAELAISVDEVKKMYAWYDFNPEITDADIEELNKTQDFLISINMQTNKIKVEDLIAKVE